MAEYYVNKFGGTNPPYVKVQGTLAWVWQPAGDGEPDWTLVRYEGEAMEQYRHLLTGNDEDFQ